jgi:hypothetical protein
MRVLKFGGCTQFGSLFVILCLSASVNGVISAGRLVSGRGEVIGGKSHDFTR